jgi:hypothetical protein
VTTRQRSYRSLFALALCASVAVTAAGCGTDNSIVGGSCAAGYEQCGLLCIAIESDPQNCGACGMACAPGATCDEGECTATVGDGSPQDGGDGSPLADAFPIPDAPEGAPLDSPESDGDAFASDAPVGLDAPVGDTLIGDAPPGDTAIADASAGDTSTANVGGDASATEASATEASATGAGDATVAEAAADASTMTEAGEDSTTEDAGGDATSTDAGDGSPVDGSENDVTMGNPPSLDGGACGPEPFDLNCGGTCINPVTNPLNCGACRIVCPSGLCATSLCVGSIPGGIILIGDDYQASTYNASQARVLSNAAFLFQSASGAADAGNPLNVLSYERYADPMAVANVDAILNAAATNFTRSLNITSTDNDTDVPNTLTIQKYGVLLIHDQVNANEADLGMLGASWSSAISTFTKAGGIVVILDGGTGAAQMPDFVSAIHEADGTPLLDVTGQSPLPAGTNLDVTAPADSVSLGVISPYAAGTNSVSFSTEPSGTSVIYVVGPLMDATPVGPTVVRKLL